MEKLKIFISGTQDDMLPERDAVGRSVNDTLLSAGIRAETTVSQPQPPRDWIEQQIQECNVYIGVYSHRYGWIIPGEDISATEFEYNLACKLDKPILVWIRKLREEEEDKPDFDRQKNFLNRVSDFSTGHLRQVFDDLNDLEKQVADGLGELFTEMIRSSRFPGKSLKPFVPEIPSWFQDPSFRNSDSSSSENQEIQLEILATELAKDKTKRFAIVGKSGCGKSVAMKAIMRSISSLDDKTTFCVYVPLGDYTQNLASTIKRNIGWQDVPDDRILIELGNLGVTLLLDALNEVPGAQRDQCRNEIKTLMASYKGGIVTSFPSVDRAHFNFECPLYEILPMDEEQIRQIVVAYFERQGKKTKAEWFFDRFAQKGKLSPEFLQWVELPLNLQFMLELGSDVQFDFRSVRDIYGQVVDRRFIQMQRQEKKGKFPVDVMKECLADLALQSLADDHGVRMSKTFAKKVFSRKLSTVETSEILIEITRSGLLNEIGDYVQWFHASLRDYMAGHSLYTLTDANSALDEFSIESPQWNGAVAYAVGLSTAPLESQTFDDLQKRPKLFVEYLQRKPAFELVRSVIQEYHHSHIVGDSSDRKGTETVFQALNWGDRFLTAYNQFTSILQNENRTLSENLPKPHGLKIFMNASGRFCTVVFSEDDGVQFEDLTRFDDQVIESIRLVKPCVGFCVHGYLLPTVDPEIMAYSQIITWLNFLVHKDSEGYQDWLRDIPSFSVFTPNEWVDWQSEEDTDLNQKPNTQTQRMTFLWQEFYAPITFCVDPVVTPSVEKFHSTRLGGLAFTRRPASHISLMFLLSGLSKSFAVDLGTRVYIPMPPIHLNRDYFVDGVNMSYTKGGPFITFIQLRG
jgi:hypothetical protein